MCFAAIVLESRLKRKRKKLWLTTPRKINMEPINDGLEDGFDFPSLKKMVILGSMHIFRGVFFWLKRKIWSIERRDWEGQGLVVVEHGFVRGHYITLFWGGQTWCKCVVSLRDFPYDSALFGFVMQWPLFIHLCMVEFVSKSFQDVQYVHLVQGIRKRLHCESLIGM